MNQETEDMNQSLEDWISKLTQKAQSEHPQVSERARAIVEQLLNGQLSDRKLSSTNLKTIARKLLTEQAQQQPEIEKSQ